MVSPEQPDNLVGKQIGQFTILEEVGRGGMATVYRATQQSINRDVALKVLPQQFLHDPGFFERFKREVDVIAHLEHPHIVPIFDYGEVDGMPYIAMRYLGGGTMRSIIKKGRPQLKDLIRPIQQVASALDHAHQQGIIHRDLKPGNVLLDAGGNAYLTDFGIARVLNSDLTGSAIIGTPAYMSPEQARGEPLDARADVYSMGVVIFELITGREPFVAETPIAMILKHLHERVPYLSEFRPDIPDDVDKVIAIATEKQAANRYSSAGALAEAFAHAVEGTASTVSIPTEEATRPNPTPAPHDAETMAELPPTPAYVPRPGKTPPMGKGMDGPTVTPAAGIAASAIREQEGISSPLPSTKASTPRRRIPGWVYTFAVTATVLVIGGAGFLLFQPGGAAPGDTAGSISTTQVALGSTQNAITQGDDPTATIAAATEIALNEVPPVPEGVENNGPETGPEEVITGDAPPRDAPAFEGARTVNTRFYSIAIPDEWIPPENANEGRPYYDETENGQGRTAVHIWQDVNLEALVTVSIADDLPTDDFEEQTDAYTERYYEERRGFTEIDEEAFEDGSLRRSYRTRGFRDFPAGQMDVFFFADGDRLAVVEVYSADATGNEMVETFQNIINSFTFNDPA